MVLTNQKFHTANGDHEGSSPTENPHLTLSSTLEASTVKPRSHKKTCLHCAANTSQIRANANGEVGICSQKLAEKVWFCFLQLFPTFSHTIIYKSALSMVDLPLRIQLHSSFLDWCSQDRSQVRRRLNDEFDRISRELSFLVKPPSVLSHCDWI